MVRLKTILKSNLLKTIKTNNKTFSRRKKLTTEPIKLKDDQGVQGVPKKGKATTKQLMLGGIFTADPGEGLLLFYSLFYRGRIAHMLRLEVTHPTLLLRAGSDRAGCPELCTDRSLNNSKD